MHHSAVYFFRFKFFLYIVMPWTTFHLKDQHEQEQYPISITKNIEPLIYYKKEKKKIVVIQKWGELTLESSCHVHLTSCDTWVNGGYIICNKKVGIVSSDAVKSTTRWIHFLSLLLFFFITLHSTSLQSYR